MHSRSFVVMVALVIAASESAAQQATSETDSRLKKLLKQAPKADANGDAVLTLEEGKSKTRNPARGCIIRGQVSSSRSGWTSLASPVIWNTAESRCRGPSPTPPTF
jgi:hypothetical protein